MSNTAWAMYRLPGQTQVYQVSGKEFIAQENIPAYPAFLYTTLSPNKKWNGFVIESDTIPVQLSGLPEWNGPEFLFTREEYLQIVSQAVKEMKRNAFAKVVHSRYQFFSIKVNPTLIFEKLCQAFPTAFVYLLFSPSLGMWCAATPEILMSSNNGNTETMALAASKTVDETREWTPKEIEEHQVVADFIKGEFQKNNIPFFVSQRHTHQTGTILHLCTRFETTVTHNNPLTKMALLLHPTPAVGGYPVEASLQQIYEVENNTRELYTGIIGAVTNEQNGHLFVNLRCMRLFANGVRIHAGGGLNAQSDAQREWDETVFKMNNILNALKK